MGWFAGSMVFMVPIVGSIALFAFLSVGAWADARRREREAYYKFEFRKRLVEAGKLEADDVKAMVEFENDASLSSRKQGMLASGLILAGTGAGLLLGLRFIEDEAVWMVGYIPLAIGIAMLAYALMLAPDVPGRPRVRGGGGQA